MMTRSWPRRSASPARSARSASTATPRAPSRTRTRCGPPWRRPDGAWWGCEPGARPRRPPRPVRDVRTRAVGDRAVLAEVGSPDEAAGLAAWLRDAGVVADDVVPAARSVLLDGVDPGAVTALLEAWPGGTTVRARRSVEVPVTYDGP